MVKGLINVRSTSLGAGGTTKTQMGSTTTLPAWGRSLEALRPYYAHGTTVTASQAVWVKGYLESEDINVNPFIWLNPPIGSAWATRAAACVPEWETWIVNAPMNGGETVKIWAQAQVANTAAAQMGCTLIIADHPTGIQRYCTLGTFTTGTATTAGEQAGTPYSIYGASHLIKVYGAYVQQAPITDTSLAGYFRLTSADFKAETPVKYGFPPINGTDGTQTTDAQLTYLKMAIYDVDIPVNPTCTIQDYANLELALGTNGTGYWQTGVVFER